MCSLTGISTAKKWFDYVPFNQYLHIQKMVWLRAR